MKLSQIDRIVAEINNEKRIVDQCIEIGSDNLRAYTARSRRDGVTTLHEQDAAARQGYLRRIARDREFREQQAAKADASQSASNNGKSVVSPE